jgi:ABC-2 type transport system permease protein
MRRYLRLYLYFLRFSFSRAMEFRVDFFFRIGMDLFWNAMYLTFFSVIFLHTGELGGWNYDQVLVFAGALFVTDALNMTLFSNNMWWFPIYVNRGDLDYYLTRPVSPLFMLSLRDFAANSFVNLLVAFGILGWAIARYPGHLGFPGVALFVSLIALGTFINYVVTMFFIIPVFWLHNVDGVRNVFWSLGATSGRPHRIYKGVVLKVLTTVLPFALVASYPVDSLFGGRPGWTLLHMATVAAAALALMLLFWRRGLRAYASASS